MRKKQTIKEVKIKEKPQQDFKLIYTVLLLAYTVIPVITPNFYTQDSNGTKFLALSILNLITFSVLLSNSAYRNKTEVQFGFFNTAVGLVYSLLLGMMLLSFMSAINLSEALLSFVKASTIFTSAYLLYVIFSQYQKSLSIIALALTTLLLFDSFTVFYNILTYISHDIVSIGDVKSVYSNKNILASAIFVKLPAVLYLLIFSRGWQRIWAIITGLSAVIATLLLSTRAFYLGLALLIVFLFLYAILRFIANRQKGPLKMIAAWGGIFIVAVFVYIGAQRYLFPKSAKSIYDVGILARLSTIGSESSSGMRVETWQRSLKMIGDHPIIGVGTGNWKVRELQYENPTTGEFTFMYKNHNDFLEITSEIGIMGGLLFISIFIVVLFSFIRTCLQPEADETQLKLLFLPAFGLLAYSVDAFFNFPADRPEIQALFAIFLSLAVAASIKKPVVGDINKFSVAFLQKISSPKVSKTMAVAVLVLSVMAIYLLSLNVKSLHFQRYVKEDLNVNQFTHRYEELEAGFPSFPSISAYGEPIAVNKARYLMNEERYRETIDLLSKDHSSPYDSRREYFMAVSYNKVGKPDSAIYWMTKARDLKPLNYSSSRRLSAYIWDKGRHEEARDMLNQLLMTVKNDKDCWLQAANFNLLENQYQKALMVLDSALKYMPGDTAIVNAHNKLGNDLMMHPADETFKRGMKAYDAKKYAEASRLLSEYITKTPGNPMAYKVRAYCYYYLKQSQQSLSDIDKFFNLGQTDYFLLTMRGINYIALGNKAQACADFKTAMDHGNPDARQNYARFCQ